VPPPVPAAKYPQLCQAGRQLRVSALQNRSWRGG
jgi:hypothetical protein